MKKQNFPFYLLLAIVATAVVFNSCENKENPRTTDAGVEINGIVWATRNVDMPGTFAEKPESFGMFYQQDRRRGWQSTGELSSWNANIPQGIAWTRANDPCPRGWRIPTQAEIQTLGDTNSVTSEWTSVNGIYGRTFTEINTGNTIFLPAVGWRTNRVGALIDAGSLGAYWSRTLPNAFDSLMLPFPSGRLGAGLTYARANGLSVRCVAE